MLYKFYTLLNFNFIMICIIHKTSVSLKTLFFKRILKEYNRILFFFKINFFSQHIMMKSPSLEKDKKMEDNITKDVRNLFRIEKNK